MLQQHTTKNGGGRELTGMKYQMFLHVSAMFLAWFHQPRISSKPAYFFFVGGIFLSHFHFIFIHFLVDSRILWIIDLISLLECDFEGHCIFLCNKRQLVTPQKGALAFAQIFFAMLP